MIGPLFIAAASLMWGIGFFIRKIILVDTNATVLAAYSYLIVALILLASSKVRKESYIALKENFLLFLGVGVFGVVGIWLFFLGLDLNTLTISVIVMRLQPIITIFFAYVYLNEKVSFKKIPWIILSILSVYLVLVEPEKVTTLFTSDESLSINSSKKLLSPKGDISFLGVLYFILAAISWVIAEIFSKKLSKKDIDSKVFTAIRFSIGAIIMLFPFIYLVIAEGVGVLYLSNLNTFLTIISALVSILLGFTLYFKGIKTTDVIVSSFIQLITPISSIALGIAFLGEDITVVQLIATVVLFLSVIFISKKDDIILKTSRNNSK